jgi:outer membrane immunogenic protein
MVSETWGSVMSKVYGLKAVVMAAAVLGAATTAEAQDNRASIWTGAYVGVHAGGAFGKFSASGFSQQISGIAGGLHAGYNWQSGNMVYGLEGDADLSGAKKTFKYASGSSEEVTNGFLGSLRGRVGFTTGSALFYGTGGVAFATLKDTYTSFAGGSASFSDTRTGYVLGLGMDYAISSSMSARIEGLHYGFKDAFKDNIGSGLKYDANVVRAGISYKF